MSPPPVLSTVVATCPGATVRRVVPVPVMGHRELMEPGFAGWCPDLEGRCERPRGRGRRSTQWGSGPIEALGDDSSAFRYE